MSRAVAVIETVKDFAEALYAGRIAPDSIIITYMTDSGKTTAYGYMASVENVRDAVFLLERVKVDIMADTANG